MKNSSPVSLTRRGRGTWRRAPAIALVASLGLLGLSSTALAQTPSPRPVVLVGPTFVNQTDLNASLGWLTQQGFIARAVALHGNPPGTASIPDTSHAVAHVVQDLLAATGALRVDLIGFSQGALAARYYLKNFPAAQTSVAGMISLGGPNYGIPRQSGVWWWDWLTNVGCLLFQYPVCSQVFYRTQPGDTPFLMALNNPDPTPGSVTYYHLYTTSSEAPGTGETIPLPGAQNLSAQQVCPNRPVPHVELWNDPVMRNLIVDALVRRPLAAPCA